jgi:hypothetical protein
MDPDNLVYDYLVEKTPALENNSSKLKILTNF